MDVNIGVELNQELVQELNSENIVTFTSINQIPSSISFDCIMMNHVLEHLYDPIETLHSLKQRMNANTILIIEVPHANDILISGYDCDAFKKFTFWSEHIILHTEKSLRRLLSQIGFEKVEITYVQRYNIFNHLHWLSHGKHGGHKHENFHDDELILSYERFLIEQKKTDTLIAYCYI